MPGKLEAWHSQPDLKMAYLADLTGSIWELVSLTQKRSATALDHEREREASEAAKREGRQQIYEQYQRLRLGRQTAALEIMALAAKFANSAFIARAKQAGLTQEESFELERANQRGGYEAMRANLTAHPKLRKMIREHDAGLLQLKEAKAKERLLMVQQERLNYRPPSRAATPEPGAKDQKRANFYALPEDILSAVENHTWAKLRLLDYRWYVRNVDAIATALKKRKALAAEQWLLVVNRDAGASRARLNHTDPLTALLDRGSEIWPTGEFRPTSISVRLSTGCRKWPKNSCSSTSRNWAVIT